jgi:phosphoribosylanthranilate isomerase
MTRVKLCGMTSRAECALAVRYGADAIGLLVGQVHAAADFVSPEQAAELCLTVPPFVTTVLVTHIEDVDEIARLASLVPCAVVQAHSDLSVSELEMLRRDLRPRRLIAKVSVEGEEAVERARSLESVADAILLDSRDRSAGRVGGTGLVHDWSVSARIVEAVSTPVILAGGLNPTNVALAIGKVRPWAVDVNSGVEDPSGTKNEDEVRTFIAAVRSSLPRQERKPDFR